MIAYLFKRGWLNPSTCVAFLLERNKLNILQDNNKFAIYCKQDLTGPQFNLSHSRNVSLLIKIKGFKVFHNIFLSANFSGHKNKIEKVYLSNCFSSLTFCLVRKHKFFFLFFKLLTEIQKVYLHSMPRSLKACIWE